VSKGFKDPSGKFHPTDGDDNNSSSNGAAMGVAVAIVVSGLISGGVGGATSVSGSVSESYGSRTSSSESDARTSRSEPDARTSGITDSFKITSRLKRLGYRVKFQAGREDKHCADYSDGEVHSFFVNNECLSLYRQLIEVEDKKSVMLFATATIVMADHQTAIDLKALLDQVDNGKIIQLSPDSGKYRHFHFANSLTTTTLDDTTVTTFDAQVVGGTPGYFVLSVLLDNALVGMGS
jgi:hypothetical protein